MGRRVHPFLSRIPADIYAEMEIVSFKHRISMNLLIVEMIKHAQRSQGFLQFMHDQYKIDAKRGHFVFIKDVR